LPASGEPFSDSSPGRWVGSRSAPALTRPYKEAEL